MKNIFNFIISLLLLAACNSHSDEAEAFLNRTEALLQSDPQSAYDSLVAKKPQVSDWSHSLQMRYWFDYIDAKNQYYIPLDEQEDLDRMKEVADYYDGDDEREARAYYLLGSVYRDQGDGPMALECFQKVLEILGDSYDDDCIHLQCITNSQIGYLLYYRSLYDISINHFHQALNDDLIIKDSLGLVHNYTDLGNSHYYAGNKDSAQIYYNKAESIAYAIGDSFSIYNVLAQKVQYYRNEGRIQEALEINTHILQNLDTTLYLGLYYLQGELFHRLGLNDSASFYYNIILEADAADGILKENANKNLGEINVSRGLLTQAIDYFNEYTRLSAINDSLQQLEAMTTSLSQYNYRLKERENTKLKEANEIKTRILWICVLITIVIILSALLITRHIHANHLKSKLQITRLNQLREEQRKKSHEYINNIKKHIQELERKLKCVESENTETEIRLQKEIQLLRSKSVIVEHQIEINKNLSFQLRRGVTYNYIKQLLDKERIIPNEYWSEIEAEINKVYIDFTVHLNEYFSMNVIEKRVCMLSKMGYTNTDISKLVGRGRSSISMLRLRLCKKIFGKNSNTKDWKDFIESL